MSTSIAEYSSTDAALADLRERYAKTIYDVTVASGMKAAKEARAVLKTWRVELEAERKRIKAPALKRCQEIDSEAKRITIELSALEDPIDELIKKEEGRKEAERKAKEEAAAKAESERVAKAAEAVASIREPILRMVGKPSSAIAECIKSIEAIDAASYEFPTEAIAARDDTLSKLDELYAASIKQEAEQKRLAAERAKLEAERAMMAVERARIEAEKPKNDDVAPFRDPPPAPGVIAAEHKHLFALAIQDMEKFVDDYGDLHELQSIVEAMQTYIEANHAS